MTEKSQRKFKIGVDATALVARPTGVGNYVRALLEPMVRNHPEAQYILFSNDEIAFPNLPNVKLRVSSPKRRGPYWQNTHLRQMLTEDKPDVFWATNGLLPVLRPTRMASVLTVHDLVYKFAPETLPFVSLWGRRLGQRAAVRAADRLVVVSHATAADAFAAYGRKPDAVIPPLANPIFCRPDAYSIARVRQKLDLGQPYLLTLGTLEPRKNIVRLISAYLRLRAQDVSLPLLAIAGGKGWLDTDIAQQLEWGESLGQVRRLGYVANEDLPALYAGCEAFLMPSIYEGFGMPLMEAQLCGAPVIHGTHASMHEAAGGLGVQTGVGLGEIEDTLRDFSNSSLPLACRFSADIVNDAIASSEQLWQLLVNARKVS